MPKILIASLLKPVDDVRSFHKIGKTLSESGFEVHILGYQSKTKKTKPHKRLHPLFSFKRLSPKRLLASFTFWRLARKLRPEIIIVQSVELLSVALCYKVLFSGRFIYDVQENYRLNIRYQSHYPHWLKPLLLVVVGLLETTSAWWVDQYWLAERSYVDELGFPPEKTYCIENKVSLHLGQKSPFNAGQLALVGTFNRHYGTLEGIRFAQELQQHAPGYQLKLLGFCSDRGYREELLQAVYESPLQVQADIRSTPVPYEEIISLMAESAYLLLPYQPNPSTARCIPTKMFEALALQLPMIVSCNLYWKNFLAPLQSAVFIDFQSFDVAEVARFIAQKSFYPTPPPPECYDWQSEGKKVLQAVRKLC